MDGNISNNEFAGLVAKQALVYGVGYVGRALGSLIDATYGCGGMYHTLHNKYHYTLIFFFLKLPGVNLLSQ